MTSRIAPSARLETQIEELLTAGLTRRWNEKYRALCVAVGRLLEIGEREVARLVTRVALTACRLTSLCAGGPGPGPAELGL